MNPWNFLEANVWLALLWSWRVQSEQAREWFERSADEPFPFCRFTPITVLRLVTTKEILGKDTKNMPEARNLWDNVWADHRIRFLTEPDGLETDFRRQFRLSSRSPKVRADAYLLAFASVAGLKLVTFDRAVGSRGAEVFIL